MQSETLGRPDIGRIYVTLLQILHNCIHMGCPRQKGSAIEVGRIRRNVRGGSAMTEEVYNP